MVTRTNGSYATVDVNEEIDQNLLSLFSLNFGGIAGAIRGSKPSNPFACLVSL